MIRHIDDEDLKVLTEEGFIDRYEQEMKRGGTYKSAYLRTEAVYKSIVGHNRYKTVNAFRQLIYRRLREK